MSRMNLPPALVKDNQSVDSDCTWAEEDIGNGWDVVGAIHGQCLHKVFKPGPVLFTTPQDWSTIARPLPCHSYLYSVSPNSEKMCVCIRYICGS